MARRHYNLPPLTTLAAFEAAGRHLSFKEAAQELSVTPGAISHQIKALESELGVKLFTRKHRGVELTTDGNALFDTLAASFGKISSSLKRIRDQNAGDVVTVGSSSAVAGLWLAQQVNAFWRDHPEIVVNQVSKDRGSWNMSSVDILVRYGQHENSSLDHLALYRDELVPVARVDYAERLEYADLGRLSQEPLIHLDTENRSWTTWQDWFSALHYEGPTSKGIRVNNYAIALQAAVDGVGLVLGWRRLIEPHLASGTLKVIGPYRLTAPHQFYVVSKPDAELSPAVQALRHWIVATANIDT